MRRVIDGEGDRVAVGVPQLSQFDALKLVFLPIVGLAGIAGSAGAVVPCASSASDTVPRPPLASGK